MALLDPRAFTALALAFTFRAIGDGAMSGSIMHWTRSWLALALAALLQASRGAGLLPSSIDGRVVELAICGATIAALHSVAAGALGVRFARIADSHGHLAWQRSLRLSSCASALLAVLGVPASGAMVLPALCVIAIAATLLVPATRSWPGTRLLALAMLSSAACLLLGREGRGLDCVLAVSMMAAIHDRHPLTAAQIGARLAHLASHDLLTTLPNRDTFVDQLKVALRDAAASNSPLAVLFLDLDRFKRLNDSFGHAVGNRLLRTLAGRLAASLPADAIVARYGGDEFTILLAGKAAASPTAAAEELLTALKRPCLEAGHEIVVTASVGVAVYPQDGRDWNELLRNASASADAAKHGGRDACRLYSTAMTSEALTLLAHEERLRRAIESHEFFVHYQPVIDLQNTSVVGCEALVRWAHPSLGVVPPIDFIDLAERTGLIVGLGGWVLGEACRQVKAWHETGNPELAVAVNISAHQLRRGDFMRTVRDALDESGVCPSALIFEITESSAMEDLAASNALLNELRDIGIKISIDDFGVGHSSLSYLRHLPADALKVDRSFVRNLPGDPTDVAILRTIFGVARSLGMGVVVEGVDCLGQLAFLEGEGCRYVQGYLFGEPVSPGDFESRYLTSPALHALDGTKH